jgi:YHS domain-containing protein
MRHVPLLLVTLLSACNTGQPAERSHAALPAPMRAITSATPSSEPTTSNQLTLVSNASQVCMVNDQFMGREQIPIQVEGKTYFGCCEMCKGRLARDPAVRTGRDPVSGKMVDKASATIAKRENGEVLYFESEETFQRFRAL